MNDATARRLAALLHELSTRCAALGPAGISALREAGRGVGNRLYDDLAPLPETLPAPAFWDALDDRLRSLGFGSLRFEPVDPGLGAVLWYAGPETAPSAVGTTRDETDGEQEDPAERAGTCPTPGCHVATGLLAGVLSRAAGRPVSVLEVECGRGRLPLCRFLFGSGDRLREVHRRIVAGRSPVWSPARGVESGPGP